LPATFGTTLDAGLTELGLALRPDQRRRIEDHVRLLIAWNAAINLTAIRDPVAIARLHVLDSLAAVPLLRDVGSRRLLDVGSGGGFPGLPLAIVLDAGALLVDSVGKKAAFLDATVRALDLPDVAATASRAEALASDRRHREAWPAVTARGVASLGELVEVAFPLLRRDGVLVAWKRGELDPELERMAAAVEALGGGTTTVVPAGLADLAGHRLVVVRKLGSTGSSWPRDPAARRRRPW
jgi:16S rRNA (guanine527-N7)-methyltransferase